MPNQQLVAHGTTVQRRVSTSVLLWNPTVVSSLSRLIPKARSSQTRLNSAMPIAPSHRHRPKIRSCMVSTQLPVPSRILLCLQPSPNSKLSPIYEISLNHGASLLLLPTTKPTSQVDQGSPTRNLQGWPLLCLPLQLIQRPGPHPLLFQNGRTAEWRTAEWQTADRQTGRTVDRRTVDWQTGRTAERRTPDRHTRGTAEWHKNSAEALNNLFSHKNSAEALNNLFSQSRLGHVVSFLLTPHCHWLSLHLQQGPVRPVPHLQGWPFSPYSHHISPLPTGLDHELQHHRWHC